MITMFYMINLIKPCILIPHSSKSVEKRGSRGRLNYLQMDCNGSDHTCIVGFLLNVRNQNKDKPMDYLHYI